MIIGFEAPCQFVAQILALVVPGIAHDCVSGLK